MGVPSSIQSEKKYSCYYLQSYVSQLYFSVVFLSHVSQSCFSVVFLSRVPQSCSSVVFLSRDSQSCFSVVFLSRVSQSFLPVVWVVWKNSPFITTAPSMVQFSIWSAIKNSCYELHPCFVWWQTVSKGLHQEWLFCNCYGEIREGNFSIVIMIHLS